ncbi:MAG: Glycolate dehydrogenase [Ignavibacteriae bacterium]|nr:MAG: Glycolate dehydrogenase [Ignavibacteriota bacterium]
MKRYNKITKPILKKIESIVGKANTYIDDETLKIYGSDETEDYSFPPEVVVKPFEAQQISELMKLANEFKIPITPRGGGTGLSGGALPIYGGICLSMEKFNRIIEIDEKNFQAVVEPGVITQKFQEEVEKFGLYYPPDPASRGSCMLGGNITENSGGPHAVKYGVTKDYVLALEVVLPDGNIINTGARTLKNVTGYNLTQLFIGSEGTLGIVTKITVRLIPLPKYKKVLLAGFNSIEDSVSAVAKIFQEGITPAAIEFIEKSAIKAAEEKLNKTFPNSNMEAHLLIEVDGNYSEVIDKEIQLIAEVLEKFNVGEIILAEERQKIESIWDLRRSIGEAVKSISAYKEEDTVVPRAKLPELVRGVKNICSKYGITSICYGHAGDGNVHINILKKNLDDSKWNEYLDQAIKEIFELTVSLGGTISGEHGIGYSQKKFLPIAISQTEIRLMKKIKKLFDPNNILNPGKIF